MVIIIRIITNINPIIGNITMITNSVVVGQVKIVVLILNTPSRRPHHLRPRGVPAPARERRRAKALKLANQVFVSLS